MAKMRDFYGKNKIDLHVREIYWSKCFIFILLASQQIQGTSFWDSLSLLVSL